MYVWNKFIFGHVNRLKLSIRRISHCDKKWAKPALITPEFLLGYIFSVYAKNFKCRGKIYHYILYRGDYFLFIISSFVFV